MLLVNDVFEVDRKTFRLLAVDETREHAYVIEMVRTGMPVRWPLADLNSRASSGRNLRVLHHSAAARPTPAADIVVRERRWSRIKDLVDQPGILENSARGSLLRDHAQRIGVTAKTLRQDLRTWWQGGQNVQALIGNYYLCGRVDEATEGAAVFRQRSENGEELVIFAPAKGAPRGRDPVKLKYPRFQIPAELKKLVLKAAWAHLSKDASKSHDGAVTAVISKLFCLRGADGEPLRDAEGTIILRPLGNRPTERQIRYLLTKAKPISVQLKSRNGLAEYANNHAPRTGSVRNDTVGPGDVYEIDATIVDVYLVARANRLKIIGKATLYLVIDRDTRLIVGFYLSLENPSWSEAVNAILSIAGDWEALCKRLGVAYHKRDWPAQGRMPNRFFADRADMITGASDSLCDGVRVQVTNAVALMSADKAIVESGFKTIHQPLRQFAPGYEPPEKYKKRRAKHYWKDGSLTLDELAANLLRICISHNRQHKPGYDATPGEILSGEALTPRDLWAKGVAGRVGLGARLPIDLLRRQLLPTGTATVKDDGVHFKNCAYEAPEIMEWLVRAAVRGVFDVQVRYTSNLVDTITIIHPDGMGKEFVARLTKKYAKFAGYSFAEVHAIAKAQRQNNAVREAENRSHKVTAHYDMEATSEAAIKATKDAIADAPAESRLSGAEELRLREAMDRRSESHDLSTTPEPYGREPVTGTEEHASAPSETSQEAGGDIEERPDDFYELPVPPSNERGDTTPRSGLLGSIRSVKVVREDGDE